MKFFYIILIISNKQSRNKYSINLMVNLHKASQKKIQLPISSLFICVLQNKKRPWLSWTFVILTDIFSICKCLLKVTVYTKYAHNVHF